MKAAKRRLIVVALFVLLGACVFGNDWPRPDSETYNLALVTLEWPTSSTAGEPTVGYLLPPRDLREGGGYLGPLVLHANPRWP